MNKSQSGNEKLGKDARREAARERARLLREEEKRKAKRNRLFVQLGVVAGVLGVVALVVVLILSSNRPPGPAPANMATDGIKIGAGFVAERSPERAPEVGPSDPVPSGDGVIDIVVYQDYLCNHCQNFDLANNAQVRGWIENGLISYEVHPISILDRNSAGSRYSTRAANAAACVANYSPDNFFEFNTLLFENRPEYNTTGHNNSALIEFAKQSGAGQLDQISECVRNEDYRSWVTRATEQVRQYSADPNTGAAPEKFLPGTTDGVFVGTPTVIVNGKVYPGDPADAAQFAFFVSEAENARINANASEEAAGKTE